MPGTVPASDGPTVSLSFANNFWGKEDAGVPPLLTRMHNAKTTGEELKAYYTARAQIEEEYARKLLNLARRPLGSGEEGTLRMSLDVVRGETECMGKEHQTIANKMKTELEEPLAAFTGGMKERRKIVQGGIEKLLKTKTQQTATVNKARDRFEQDCLKIKGYLAQGHMVMGQEERKNKAKLEKTQIQMSSNSTEYETAVKVLEETTGKWNREWKAACDKFQDLEEERLDFFKSSLWTYANIASTVCVSDDASCEKIRLSLEDCDVEKDITGFIKQKGTGQDIPDPPKYINFCRGDIDDASSTHGSDDGNYSVAQFQRTMNPAFRTSSPQPSIFESHHDPDSSLREDMGIPKAAQSVDGDFHPRSSQNSASVPPLAPSQASSGAAPAYSDVPQVPHNPYPTDGMTQFCRMGPPSERSTVPSPTRPESRDSHEDRSDYSAPTSFSSFDPTSGHASPTKHYNGSNVSAVSSIGDEKTIQKKKSGFFSNSPFRRRSQKLKDGPAAPPSATPSQRNTWTPANMPRENGSSPSKPFGRGSLWGKLPSASPDPDPVDPRADYQLGIGNNVFDVAHPDAKKPSARKNGSMDLDPIAQALADLKSVTKQATVRESADRHYGMKTPAPPSTPGMVPTPFANSGNSSTPPPAYDMPPVSRLGAPQPAHTKKEMQRTTERYVNGRHDTYSSGGPSRPSSSMGQHSQAGARAPSPGPPRSASPRPFHNGQPPRSSSPNPYAAAQQHRSSSPNPYASQSGGRVRSQSNSPMKHQPSHSGYGSRGGSPGYQVPRAASPNPAYSRPHPSAAGRAPSSRGSDHGGGMALQLAPAGDGYGSQRGGRPQSQYYAGDGSYGAQSLGSRQRSHSAGTQRQVTKEGRPILHYARAMYMYQAAIPEELSFAKGDVLAVLRHQDDGWWEAEVCGQGGQPGLVPSNYLKNC